MNWDAAKAQKLGPEEAAEIAAHVEVWRAAVKKIANASVSEDRMLQMLRLSGKLRGDAHQLREDLKKLEGRRNKLRKRIAEHSEYVEAFRSMVEPAATGFGIPALTAEALGSLVQHGDQLRAVKEAHDALIREHDALLFQMSSRQRHVASADDLPEGSANEVNDPPEFDAGRLVEVLEAECGVMVEQTALLVALYERASKWPLAEEEVLVSLRIMVRDPRNPIKKTKTRVSKQRTRWLARKESAKSGLTLLLPSWKRKKSQLKK